MSKVQSFSEYETLVCAAAGNLPAGVRACDAFDELLDFVLGENEIDGFFKPGKLPGFGKCVRLQNYVGVIRFRSGHQVEILPKISGSTGPEQARGIVLDMLRCLTHTPFRQGGTAAQRTCKMPLLDAFIHMYLREVQALVRGGIRADYVARQGNLNRLRGRIMLTPQLRHNILHPERLYCAYDEYDLNCPENRLVKTTLLVLRRHTTTSALVREIDVLLQYFDEVDKSVPVDADFNKVRTDRSRRAYMQLMNWARVFLQGRSFSSFAGRAEACVLLFPMERLFEDYVAHYVRLAFQADGWRVTTQARGHYLFDSGGEHHFSVRPDILLEKDGRVLVMDTKWKLLENTPARHYGIQQADMYQMSAYATEMASKDIFLLYPRLEWMPVNAPLKVYHDDASGVNVHIYPVDMLDVKRSADSLASGW